MDPKNSRSEEAHMDKEEEQGDTADNNSSSAAANDDMALDDDAHNDCTDDASKKTAGNESGEKSATPAVPAASASASVSQNKASRHQAAAASAAANDLLRLLGDASNSLSCIQGVDGCTFVVFNGGQLAQMLQAGGGGGIGASNSRIHVATGHEKDAVCIEDICAAARTYATQVCAQDFLFNAYT